MTAYNQKPQNTSQENHRILFKDDELNTLAREFLKQKFDEGVSESTLENYCKTFRAFQFVFLKDFDRKNFIEWSAQRIADHNWTQKTLANHYRRLCCFNRFLFYNSLVLRLHRAPRCSNRPKRRELPSKLEWSLLFDSLKKRYEDATLGRRKSRWRDYLICRVLFETGVRISEAARLRVGDLVIHDVGQYYLFILPEASPTNSLKTDDSERAVIISEKLCEEIRAYLWSYRIQNKQARMFASKTGKSLDTIEFSKWIKSYCASLQIEPVITPHVFRHNFILEFIAAGHSMGDLMARLGHSDVKMSIYYFRQVRRLMPFVKCADDFISYERRFKAKGRFFQKQRGNDDE